MVPTSKVLEANPAVCFGCTRGLQGSRSLQKWVSPPLFGQDSRRNSLPQGGDSGQCTAGPTTCRGRNGPVKTSPATLSGFWPGTLGWVWLAWGRGVNGGIPHSGSKLRLYQPHPLNGNGVVCGDTVQMHAKNAKKAERNNMRSTTLRFYYFFFIYFYHPPKVRAYPSSEKKLRNFSLPPPPHTCVQQLIQRQQSAALLDSVVFFNARVNTPVRALWLLRASTAPTQTLPPHQSRPLAPTPTVTPLPVQLRRAYFYAHRD